MKRSPWLVTVVLVATTFCGLAGGQSGELPRPPVVRPPAIPPGAADRLEFRAPAPPPPAEVPRPPAPPPTTDRACGVRRQTRSGEIRRDCVDISARCRVKGCPAGTVCGLNLDVQVECFPESVQSFQNCGPDFFRRTQPCPADSGIRGYGMGCNYCIGGNPFERGTRSSPSSRRLTGALPPYPAPPAPVSSRACPVSYDSGEARSKCVDISARCRQRQCPSSTVCALDLENSIQCLTESQTAIENCGSEESRREQPCPPDTGITGFGMGCTYCVGGNPFVRGPEPPFMPVTEQRQTSPPGPPGQPPSPPAGERACIVVHIRDGNFKEECVDISERCAEQNCPVGTVCGLDLDENITCFDESVRDFQNCGPESFRLQQPCPADSGIKGFGMGCNFCVGGNPFGSRPNQEPRLIKPPEISSPLERACMVVHVRDGNFKRECIDISERCAKQNCPTGTVCGLDLDENITCFDESVRNFQSCGPESFRLQQPCPADSGIKGFGMGCNFCVGGNPFGSRPTQEPRLIKPPEISSSLERACVVVHIRAGNFKEECVDISERCAEQNCPTGTVCGLDLDENITCFDESVRDFQNCGPESFRLQQPCPADSGIKGFGMGCNFCVGGNPFEPPQIALPGPAGPPPPPGPAAAQNMAASASQSITDRVACVSRITTTGALRRGCMDITDLCHRRSCPADRTCALDIDEQPSCFAASQLPIRNCGSTGDRVAKPCPDGAEVVAFGAGCTYCRQPPTTAPAPTAGRRRRACVVYGTIRRCQAIEARCAELACPEICALGPDSRARCFAAADLPMANCGPERRRLDQPCQAGMTAVAFGAGCTYCRPL